MCTFRQLIQGINFDTPERMARLLIKNDFLSLLEKGMLLAIQNGPSCKRNYQSIIFEEHDGATILLDCFPEEAWNDVLLLLCQARNEFTQTLRRDYLNLLDHLRTRAEETEIAEQRNIIMAMITIWERFADATGTEEAELRADALAGSERDAGSHIGCGWVKCPMFELDDPAFVQLRCAGCGKTRYCGLECQKR